LQCDSSKDVQHHAPSIRWWDNRRYRPDAQKRCGHVIVFHGLLAWPRYRARNRQLFSVCYRMAMDILVAANLRELDQVISRPVLLKYPRPVP
jgi:hypothetical protein